MRRGVAVVPARSRTRCGKGGGLFPCSRASPRSFRPCRCSQGNMPQATPPIPFGTGDREGHFFVARRWVVPVPRAAPNWVQRVYLNQPGVPTGGYSPDLDYMAWQQWFGVASQSAPAQTGLGEFGNPNQILAYMRRAGAAPYTCGNPIVFAGLLPTRAVHAAAQAISIPTPPPIRLRSCWLPRPGPNRPCA